jgi:predicted DCC family thiol-disulfide oxidoreductase YuxK
MRAKLDTEVTTMLTIFYDGKCPLCSAEMRSLKKHDTNQQINLFDLHNPDLEKLYPEVDFSKAMKILHGYYQGKILLGLEVTHRAWTMVGKGFWVAPLNWPILKTISHWFYLLIAKHRHPISAILARALKIQPSICEDERCSNKASKFQTDRR